MLDQTAIEPSSVASPIVTEEVAPHDIELSDIFCKFITLYSIRLHVNGIVSLFRRFLDIATSSSYERSLISIVLE
jgi:hypothetical protein